MLDLREFVRIGASDLRMFKIEIPEDSELAVYTLFDPAVGDKLIIGHEALCWLVVRGYASVALTYPDGTWTRA
ncbi:MAG: hypothetical protein QM778_34400 [Myxococcales bacterium]